MPADKQVHIAKHVKMVDWLKTEIVDGMSSLFHGLHETDEEKILDGMAEMIVMNYLLARRLGIPFYQLEQVVLSKLKDLKQEDKEKEVWDQDMFLLKDLSLLEEFLSER